MKKLLALALSLALFLPVAALADVLADGWQDASMEELQDAQQSILNRISELRAAATPVVDAAHYEGAGTAMVSVDAFPSYPCRMVFAVDAPGDAKLEITGGKQLGWKQEFTAAPGDLSRVLSYDSVNYGGNDLTLLVTTSSNWTLDIYPLAETGTVAFSGAGNAVSDLFTLSSPQLVTLSYDGSAESSGYLSVTVVTPSQYGYLRESVFSESVGGKSGTTEVFVKPKKDDQPCFYIVECKQGIMWEIAPKN